MSIEQFVLPPEFRTGQFLGASQLNQLGQAIGYLDGRVNGVNMAMAGLIVDTSLSTSNNIWYVQHIDGCDYLHYYMTLNDTLSGDLEIHLAKADGTSITQLNPVIDATPTAGESPYSGYYDISSTLATFGVGDGDWYQVRVASGGGSTYTLAVHYLIESNGTALTWPTTTGASRPTSPPFTWAHADLANSAPTMDLYSDWLDYLRDRVGQVIINPAVLEDREQAVYFPGSGESLDQEDSGITIVHQQPWLVFRGTGEIVDPAGVSDSVALSDDNELTAYDLSQVSWLTYGTIYRVEGCDFACETSEVS